MSPRTRQTLAALRAVGPCPNRVLAKALKMPPDDCYHRLAYLRTLGLAVWLGPHCYAVTAEGRRELLVGKAPIGPTVTLFDGEDRA